MSCAVTNGKGTGMETTQQDRPYLAGRSERSDWMWGATDRRIAARTDETIVDMDAAFARALQVQS